MLQEESHTIGLQSIQTDKYETCSDSYTLELFLQWELPLNACQMGSLRDENFHYVNAVLEAREFTDFVNKLSLIS